MSDTNQPTYYDLFTSGVAFINRFRQVKPTNGDPYYAVTLAALRGKQNGEGKVAKTYIDCNVVGPAIEMAEHLAPIFDVEKDQDLPTVMVKFVAGDLEQHQFTYRTGKRKGEIGHSLKARLFDIKWYKHSGDTVYSEAELKRHADNDSAPPQSDDAIGGDQAASAADSTPQQVHDKGNVSDLPSKVMLDKEDPYFAERTEQLKRQGYQQWDDDGEHWVLPKAS